MTTKSMPAAVLFDVDGTLVDSTYVHVAAWLYALQLVDRYVEARRIHRAIGMDGGKLLKELLGSEVESLGEQAKQEHDRRYKMMQHLLKPFDGARDLLRALQTRGIKVVLATSAPPDELTVLRRLLDVEDAVDAVTNADDVETAKPSPDIVSVALERVGVPASEAIFVGDAVWDVRAADALGVVCIGGHQRRFERRRTARRRRRSDL